MKWQVEFTALGPISHNDEASLSTTTPFRRIKVDVNGSIEHIPVYTGNAWRGILRRNAAMDFVQVLGLEKLTQRQYHILFTGGMLDQGSSGDIDLEFKRKLREMIPFMSVFGGATGNTVIQGKLIVGMLFPVAKETAQFTGIDSDRSIFEFLDTIFYTHRDDREIEAEVNETVQMKYEIEVLVPGTVLVSEIILQTEHEIEVSAFGAALKRWLKDPYLGGRSAIGHGKVKVKFDPPDIPDAEPYHEYLKSRKKEILQFLEVLG